MLYSIKRKVVTEKGTRQKNPPEITQTGGAYVMLSHYHRTRPLSVSSNTANADSFPTEELRRQRRQVTIPPQNSRNGTTSSSIGLTTVVPAINILVYFRNLGGTPNSKK